MANTNRIGIETLYQIPMRDQQINEAFVRYRNVADRIVAAIAGPSLKEAATDSDKKMNPVGILSEVNEIDARIQRNLDMLGETLDRIVNLIGVDRPDEDSSDVAYGNTRSRG